MKKSMRKKIMSIITVMLLAVMLVPGEVFAEGSEEYTPVDGLAYTSVDGSCHINIYATEGGTVNKIGENDDKTFSQLLGYKQYQAVADEGYRFVGFSYELTCEMWLAGNGVAPNDSQRTSFRGSRLGTFYRVSSCSSDGTVVDNAKTAYVSSPDNDMIQLNRLLSVGESVLYPLTYNVYAKFEKIPTYTVTYTDGVDDEEVFADQTYTEYEDADTPAFSGSTTREEYIFTGWDPDVEEKVTKDATYAATWAEDKNGNGIDDAQEPKYTVTYTDGVEDEEIFADQKTEVLSGLATPEFNGTPTRKGYTFKGWNPKVELTVTDNAVYTAVWEKDTVIDKEDGNSGNKDNTNTNGNTTKNSNDKANTSKTVQTGDNSNIGIWAILMMLCAAVVVTLTVRKKVR